MESKRWPLMSWRKKMPLWSTQEEWSSSVQDMMKKHPTSENEVLQSTVCVCVCVLRCVIFGQGPCVCVLCISALNALSRCVVFWQCTCQDVSSLGRGPCVCVHLCVCVLSFYFCPKCIVKMSSFGNAPVKMCRLWAGGLVCVCMCVCVCSFFLFLP